MLHTPPFSVIISITDKFADLSLIFSSDDSLFLACVDGTDRSMLKIIEEEFRGPPIIVRNCIYQAVIFIGAQLVHHIAAPLGYNER